MDNFTELYEDVTSDEISLKEIADITKIKIHNVDDLINNLLITICDIKSTDISSLSNIEILENNQDVNATICALLTKVVTNTKISKKKATMLLGKAISKSFITLEIIRQFIKEFGFKIDSKRLKVVCFKYDNEFVLKISYGETVIEFYINPKEESIKRLR